MSKVNGFEFEIDRKVIFTNESVGAFQTSSSIVKLMSVFIPANSFAANDICTIQYRCEKSNGLGIGQFQFYWNTSDTLTSATQLSTRANTASLQYTAGLRRIAIRTSNNNTLISGVSYGQDTDYSNWLGVNPSTVSINWTVDSYLLLGGNSGGSTPVRCISLNISN